MRNDAVELADKILTAAGSGFRHYVPSSKERIVAVAAQEIDAIKAKAPPVAQLPEKLVETMQILIRPDYDLGCNVVTIEAKGMPKFQIDDATAATGKHVFLFSLIRELLLWVQGKHTPSITYIGDRDGCKTRQR